MTNTETNPNDEAQKAADWEALVISSFELVIPSSFGVPASSFP
jgi:hypothetical protein